MNFKKLIFFLILFTNFYVKPLAELRFMNNSSNPLYLKLMDWGRGLAQKQEDLQTVGAKKTFIWSTASKPNIKQNTLEVYDTDKKDSKPVITITMPFIKDKNDKDTNYVIPSGSAGIISFVDKDLYSFTVVQKDRKLTEIFNIGVNILQKSLEAIEEILFAFFAVQRKAIRETKDLVPYNIIHGDPYVKKDAQVRVGGTVAGKDEKAAFANRQKIVKEAQEKLLGIKFAADEKPLVIAFVASGGGQRARLCTIGSLLGAKQTGLFDCGMYLATLSGSTWFAAPWMLSGLSLEAYEKRAVQEVQSDLGVGNKEAQKDLIKRAEDAAVNIPRIVDSLNVKFAFAQPIGFSDIYGALLAISYLKGLDWEGMPIGKNGDPNRCYLSSLDNQKMRAGQSLIPIFTAVTADVGLGHVWCEFTPWEFGSRWFGANGAYIPVWAFGRKFESLNSTKNWGTKESPLYESMQNVGFLMGIWGSAPAANLGQIYDQVISKNKILNSMAASPVKALLEAILKKTDVKQLRFVWTDVNNFMYNWSGEAKFSKSKYLKLADAGIKYINPIFPTYRRPEQGKFVEDGSAPDVIIVWDAGGSKSGADEFIMQSKYAEEHNHPFPKIDLTPEDESVIRIFNQNPLKKLKNGRIPKDHEIPTVIYLKRRIDKDLLEKCLKDPKFEFAKKLNGFKLEECVDKGTCKTFNFLYDDVTAQKLIDMAKFNTIANIGEIKTALRARIDVNRKRDNITVAPAKAAPVQAAPVQATPAKTAPVQGGASGRPETGKPVTGQVPAKPTIGSSTAAPAKS